MFSRRTAWDRVPNRLSTALELARRTGPLIDLTLSNPTAARIFDAAPLVALLGRSAATLYEPLPFGHPTARAAVADFYARRGVAVSPDRVVLTASTSEAYGWLFTLLADAGDDILVPRPSYPLLDWLGKTHEVRLPSYRLSDDAGFRLDLDDIERALTPRTRAIVLVHPNNPTGNFVRVDDAERLVRLAKDRDLALVVDEVFADYRFGGADAASLPTFAATRDALVFVLNGLSKALLLPQVKLGWVVVSGPTDRAREAMDRIELMADTFLSVGTPVQLALPDLLERAPVVLDAARERLRTNLAALDRTLAASRGVGGLRRLPVEGGWYAIVEVPRFKDEEEWALTLLANDRVVVQPGYFFEFEREGRLVLSLLPEPATFERGVARLVERVELECAQPGV